MSPNPNKNQASTVKSTTTTVTRKSNDEDFDSTYFDKFLKSTTEMSYSTTDDPSSSTVDFNFTDVDIENFNLTDSDIKTLIFDQNSQNNDLENTTEFRKDVEEMFEDVLEGANRTKREIRNFDRERRQLIISCHNAGGFTSARQRWWYIALANCGSAKGIDVRYRFKMTNGPPGDFWHEHFSADESCKKNFLKIGKFLINLIFFSYSTSSLRSNVDLYFSSSRHSRLWVGTQNT